MSEFRHPLVNTLPAPDATEATRPGTVSDLARPGEGVLFDAYQCQTSRKGVIFLAIAHIRGVVCNEFKIYCGQYLYRMRRRRHISAALTDGRLGGDYCQHSIKQDNKHLLAELGHTLAILWGGLCFSK